MTSLFIIQAGFNNLENYRVGFTTSKRVGNAVARNRCKRRMRAAARALFPSQGLNGVDYVLIAKAKTLTAQWNVLIKEFERALRAINGKIGECVKF